MDILAPSPLEQFERLYHDAEANKCSTNQHRNVSFEWNEHNVHDPLFKDIWDEEQEDFSSLLLREIELLNLPAFDHQLDPDVTIPTDNCEEYESTLCPSSSTQRSNKQLSVTSSCSPAWSWQDTIDAFTDSPHSNSFDLLSYAESSDDSFLWHSKISQEWASPELSGTADEVSSPPDDFLIDLKISQTQFSAHSLSKHLQSQPEEGKDQPGEGECSVQYPEKQSRRLANEPKRPKNGFIRYSMKHRAELAKKYPCKDNRSISKLLGIRWKKMSAEEKRPYEEAFSIDIHQIRSQNPAWRYAPARKCADDLVDPMITRLRPRDKIFSRITQVEDFDSDLSQDSPQGWNHVDTCSLTQQPDMTLWKPYNTEKMLRPKPGLVNMAELPNTRCSYATPSKANISGIASVSPCPSQFQEQSNCLSTFLEMTQTRQMECQQPLGSSSPLVKVSHQSPLLLVYSLLPLAVNVTPVGNMPQTIIINPGGTV